MNVNIFNSSHLSEMSGSIRGKSETQGQTVHNKTKTARCCLTSLAARTLSTVKQIAQRIFNQIGRLFCPKRTSHDKTEADTSIENHTATLETDTMQNSISDFASVIFHESASEGDKPFLNHTTISDDKDETETAEEESGVYGSCVVHDSMEDVSFLRDDSETEGSSEVSLYIPDVLDDMPDVIETLAGRAPGRPFRPVPGLNDSMGQDMRQQMFWPTRNSLVQWGLKQREVKRRRGLLPYFQVHKAGWKERRREVKARARKWQGILAERAASNPLYTEREERLFQGNPAIQIQPMRGGSGGAYWIKERRQNGVREPVAVLKVQAEAAGAVFCRKAIEEDGVQLAQIREEPAPRTRQRRLNTAHKELTRAMGNLAAQCIAPDAEKGFVRDAIPPYREAFSEHLASAIHDQIFPDDELVPKTTVHVVNHPDFFDYTLDPRNPTDMQKPRNRVCSVQEFVHAHDFQKMLDDLEANGLDQDEFDIAMRELITSLDEDSVQKLALLDLIIGMTDRHGDNLKVTEDKKVIGIDHGLAFPKRHEQYRFILLNFPQVNVPLSQDFIEIITSLDPDDLSELLEDWEHADAVQPLKERIQLMQWCIGHNPEMTLKEMGCRIILLEEGLESAMRPEKVKKKDVPPFGLSLDDDET